MARLLSAGWTGRVPMGAGAPGLPAVRGGEPPGEDVDVRDDCCCCAAAVAGFAGLPLPSKSEKFGALEAGEDVLSARECRPEALGEGPLGAWASSAAEVGGCSGTPNELYASGEGPRGPLPVAVGGAWPGRGVWPSPAPSK